MQSDDISIFKQNMSALEQLILQAKRVPLSAMCMVDKDKMSHLLEALTKGMPTVFVECQGVIANQKSIVDEAEARAGQIKQAATNQASKLLNDAQAQAQKTVAAANQQAQETVNKAGQQANAMLQEAQERSQNMVQDAERRAAQLVSQQEITARANMEAEELKQSTKEEIERLYHDVYQHIDEVLAQLDRTISEKLTDIRMTRQQAEGFYAVHKERPFFASLTEYMSSGPVVCAILEGDKAISRYRELMGATNPANAAEGTIRKKYAESIEANSVHGSDAPETAAYEMAYFFNALEITG